VNPTTELAKVLIGFGGALVLVGLVILLTGRFLNLGHLPGDIRYEGQRTKVYVPIVGSIVISIILTLLLNLLLRWKR
jgi:hypothetical protein